MEPITATALSLALAQGLMQVGDKLIEKGVIEPALEPATERLQQFVRSGYDAEAGDEALQNAVATALEAAGAPAAAEAEEDEVRRWLKQMSLDRLTAEHNDALRRQVARAVVTFTDPNAEPPDELVTALQWPRTKTQQLAVLLRTLRAELYTLEGWRAPIEYADEAAKLDHLDEIRSYLARVDNLIVETDAGTALQTVIVEQGLTRIQAQEAEERYKADLRRELRMHDFQGIVQVRRDMRLPLADIYTELRLQSFAGEQEHRKLREQMLRLSDEERADVEERQREDQHVTDALAEAQRLVILGAPGAGKTISLRFIALMLAHGGSGAARLGLDAPYIPLMVRLADVARAIEEKPHLSLDNFLLDYIGEAYTSHERLREYLRLALDSGTCMVLLDGLDEVGDDPKHGRMLRSEVVKAVQRFADRWCTGTDRNNRLVVTSRIEGYWDAPLRDVTQVQLSPLSAPDGVRAFLQRWYTAHEQAHDDAVSLEEAEARAQARVEALVPRITAWPSVRRLATNPLLLTILALIHDNIGKLPNRRIRVYEIAARTLIESWREAQVGLRSELLDYLGEETIVRIMAPLAYWLHDEQPGGTASFDAWRARLIEILGEEGFEDDEAEEVAARFLVYARSEAGLLTERGLDQFGFFHLTFEEYLAAREIARKRVEERRDMLEEHWEEPGWREVILLAAGQLGIVEARRGDVSDFIRQILDMQPQEPENVGRNVVLAGRALLDIGTRSVTPYARRTIVQALRETMQDRSMSGAINDPPVVPVRTRYDAGEVLDELGWLPDDLHAWVQCDSCSDDGSDLLVMKYPLTNAQWELFMEDGGYEEPAYWGGEESAGWRWRVDPDNRPSYRQDEEKVTEPDYWQHPRYGKERRGYPVVGISWYEADAYAAWVSDLLRRDELTEAQQALVQDLLAERAGAPTVRLPSDGEWECAAGGTDAEDRYAWDPPEGPATQEEQELIARANIREAGIGGTSPVGMYPQGASNPFGLRDVSGNVWEWTGSWYGEGERRRSLRGGSWSGSRNLARVALRDWYSPYLSYGYFGVRLVSPVSAGF